MRHGRWPLRQWRGHLALKQVRHALAAGGLVAESGRGTFALGSPHLTHPNRDSIAQAARSGLEPATGPIRIRCRAMQARLAVEAVKIGADELAVLHADAGIVDEVGHAAGGVDLVVGAIRYARLRSDHLDAVLQTFLEHYDARQSRIGRC